ncbi:MAG: CHY zinc finger protein [Chthonomonadales bacterium]
MGTFAQHGLSGLSRRNSTAKRSFWPLGPHWQVSSVTVGNHEVFGVRLDAQTRCEHYHSELDVIAIRHYCCKEYYACIKCHEELARHANQVWPALSKDEKVVLCGVCGVEMTMSDYIVCNSNCPSCGALFNPGCRNHWPVYFEV